MMEQLDNEKFGAFVAQLRKEKGMTQKELADCIHVSDKAVSKWERGLSMPGVSLLIPLAELLGVTVTELLKGERVRDGEKLEIGEVEGLVKRTMDFPRKERRFTPEKKKWIPWYLLTVLICLLELLLFSFLGWTLAFLMNNVILVMILMLVFGFCFCFYVRERLPNYYDENRIDYFHDGMLRMNMPGVTFNNRNWPYILKAVRISTMSMAVGYPFLFLLLSFFFGPDRLLILSMPVTLICVFSGIFIPIYAAAWRHK